MKVLARMKINMKFDHTLDVDSELSCGEKKLIKEEDSEGQKKIQKIKCQRLIIKK